MCQTLNAKIHYNPVLQNAILQQRRPIAKGKLFHTQIQAAFESVNYGDTMTLELLMEWHQVATQYVVLNGDMSLVITLVPWSCGYWWNEINSGLPRI